MLGTLQLDQMQFCINDVCDRGIPGDLLEAGVWRGGMTVFMRGVLKARRDNLRRVWVADSFAGLPHPDARLDTFGWKAGDMAVSLDEVKTNFMRYGLLDDQVTFLQGFFRDTLPAASIPALSVLRVDADLYGSTLDVLNSLYPKLSIGGYAIFDDYQNLNDCRKAVDEYRQAHGICDQIIKIDTRAIFWIKTAASAQTSQPGFRVADSF
jgi:O-methyltransferase